jgi:hypothetical protein
MEGVADEFVHMAAGQIVAREEAVRNAAIPNAEWTPR